MPLTLLLGGARSGKSALAVRLAAAAASTRPVVVVVTGEARDDEMAERITRHRAERPVGWTTVEAPTDLAAAIAGADEHAFVVIDCLTLWVANLSAGHGDDEVVALAREAADLAAVRPAPTVAVSNEVGSGIVPFDPAVRAWRDLLGSVNAVWAAAADRAALVVAGRLVALERAEDVLGG